MRSGDELGQGRRDTIKDNSNFHLDPLQETGDKSLARCLKQGAAGLREPSQALIAKRLPGEKPVS